MLEIIKKYKNGLIGVIFFWLLSGSSIFHVGFYQLFWYIFFFVIFQYTPKPSFISNTIIAKDGANSLNRILSANIILLGFFSFGMYIGGEIGRLFALLAFFLGPVFLIIGSVQSVSLYSKTKEKRFILFLFAFGLILLVAIILFLYVPSNIPPAYFT